MSKPKEQSHPAEECVADNARTSRRAFVSHSVGAGGSLLLLGACAEGQDSAASPETPKESNSSGLPPGKDPANFIVHGENPMEIETRRAAFGMGTVVPYGLLFVRNNLPMPDESFVRDRDAWKVSVEGVGRPGELTLAELKRLGVETVAAVVQCSGNGRDFFEHTPSGAQWGVGAAGCVIWTGVPVRAVAEALGGVSGDARFATGTGGEVLPTEEGTKPKDVIVERSIPVDKALEDALLAWEMNGEPLPLAHGGPLRLVVPGYYGVNQIKYLKRLAFSAEESDARIMRSRYRLRPRGVEANPSQPSTWEMGVKSWINHPSGDTRAEAGQVVVDGAAFSGTGEIRRVEVSTDGGQNWQNAPLVGPNLGKYAWRQFAVSVTLQPGTHTLASRAIDAAGNTQPADRVDDESGYANTSWRDHAVTVTVA